MKIGYFNCQTAEEHRIDRTLAELKDVEVHRIYAYPSMENLDEVNGCDCVSVTTTAIGADLLKGFAARGVIGVNTRSVGSDHIDLAAARENSLQVSVTSYTPDSVANYTVMLMLMCLRKAKFFIQRTSVRDYSLPKNCGRNLANCTVGVIGTGRIGSRVIQNLSGFGCHILCNDVYQNEETASRATYVDLNTLFRESDIVTLHAPALESSYHLVNRDTLAMMKQGSVVINAARGSLLDTGALLEALESGHIAAAALDVLEEESELLLHDMEDNSIRNHTLSLLSNMPNVILSPHMAFKTEESMDDIVYNSILSCVYMYGKKADNPWKVV